MRFALALLAFAVAGSWATPLAADPDVGMGARGGLELARAAARSWAPDARLVYLENDEAIDETGRSVRWGYLFHSAGHDLARAYSVREGKIRHAQDLEIRLFAPPLEDIWIDSDVALARAEEKIGRRYRESLGGSVATMLLLRSALHPDEPEHATWTIVYRAEGAPSLFVLVDAGSGDVVKTWRG